jgi:hypothetical protein
MTSSAIETVLSRFRATYGADAIALYGALPDEEHGTCFTVHGIPATFSVHTQDGGLHDGRYDVQIESQPPGDYVFTAIVALDRLLELATLVSGPRDLWP